MRKGRQFFRNQAKWNGGLYGDEPMPTNFRVKKVDSLIDRALASFDFDAGVDEQRLQEVWIKVVGSENAKFTKPLSLKKGVLRIAILQPSMRFHYQQIHRHMLKKIQQELPDEGIKSLSLVVS